MYAVPFFFLLVGTCHAPCTRLREGWSHPLPRRKFSLRRHGWIPEGKCHTWYPVKPPRGCFGSGSRDHPSNWSATGEAVPLCHVSSHRRVKRSKLTFSRLKHPDPWLAKRKSRTPAERSKAAFLACFSTYSHATMY